MNPTLHKLVKEKKRLFNNNRATKWKHEHLVYAYHSVNSVLKKQCKLALSTYELTLVSDKLNPKRLFAYIKSQQKISSGINFLSHNNDIISDRQSIANALNNQFYSVFVKDPLPLLLATFPPRTTAKPTNHQVLTELAPLSCANQPTLLSSPSTSSSQDLSNRAQSLNTGPMRTSHQAIKKAANSTQATTDPSH